MENQQIPDTFNGKPTDYVLFDGFKQSNLAMKAVYILGVPLASVLIEGYYYNEAQHNAKAARAFITEQEKQKAGSNQGVQAASFAPDLTTTLHQDALTSQQARAQTQGRSA